MDNDYWNSVWTFANHFSDMNLDIMSTAVIFSAMYMFLVLYVSHVVSRLLMLDRIPV